MKPYRLASGVRDEIDRALAATAKPAAFRRVVEQALADICANPQIAGFVGRSKAIRQFVLPKRFPYSIVYADTPGEVLVFAFAHHKQKPGYWKARLSP